MLVTRTVYHMIGHIFFHYLYIQRNSENQIVYKTNTQQCTPSCNKTIFGPV